VKLEPGSLAAGVALSNWAMAPRTWRTSTGVGCSSWDQRDPERFEKVVAGELHGEIAGEPVGALHKDDRTPLLAMRSSKAAKPGRTGASPAATITITNLHS
jgi:hypothetical protein